MMPNKRAWGVVEKYLPTHCLSITGPCCDKCSLMLKAVTDAMVLAKEESKNEEPVTELDIFALLCHYLSNGTFTQEQKKYLSSFNTAPPLFGPAESVDQPDGFGTDSE